MSQFSAEDLAWHQQQRELCASPDSDARSGGLVRTLGKRCPHCPNVFFTYQCEGQEREPYRVDRDPDYGQGVRETCGSPICHDREDAYQFARRVGFRAEAAAARAARAAKAQATPKQVVML